MIRYLWDVLFVLFGLVIIRELCIRLNPMWVRTTQLFDQYCVTGKSNVVYQSSMNSLQQYQRYATPDGADRWLKRLIKQGEIDAVFVVDRLSMNSTLQADISAQLREILASHAAPFSRSVSKRIIRKRMPMIWLTYPSELQIIISYTSPAGRNHYASSYVWNARELQNIDGISTKLQETEASVFAQREIFDTPKRVMYHVNSVQPKPVTRSCLISQSSPTANGIVLDGLSSEVDVTTNHGTYALDAEILSTVDVIQSNGKVDTIFSGLYIIDARYISAQCFAYLQKYKAYTSEEYRQKCAYNGKKRIPGCYIIYNTVTKQVYVGQAVDIMRRVQEHLNGKRSGGERLDYDIAILNHRVLIKHVLLSESGYLDLNELERDLIRACDCVEPRGYNKTRGNGY